MATIGTVIAVITYEPYVPINYSIAYPKGPFVRMKESCPNDAGTHYFTAKISTGKEISIDLCLLSMAFGDKGDRLIPYKVDEKGVIWGAASYSREVTEYEKQLEPRFALPPADQQSITTEISKRYRGNMKDVFSYWTIGLAIFYGIAWAIGWIVRGFLGIPRGMDNRPE